MIFRELSNTVFRFVLGCAGAEIDEVVFKHPPPPPAGGGKSRGPAGRGLSGKCSTWTSVSSGTPEGSILSPLLFACYINDLPDAVESGCLLFADDVKLYHRIKTQTDCDFLQRQLDALCHWSQLWGMSLNPGRCKVLTLSLRRDRVIVGYDVGDVTLERVSTMRDLGVILDEKLTFADHLDCVARKANRALGLLMRSFQTGKHGKTLYNCDFRAIISAYCANVRSVLEYGSVIWSGAADTHLSRLESIQHKFMVWLCCRCRFTDVPLRYDALERRFSLEPLSKRRQQRDLLFVRNVHSSLLRLTGNGTAEAWEF